MNTHVHTFWRELRAAALLLLLLGFGSGAGAQTSNALNFDGTDDYAQAATNLSPGTGDFTLEAWVKPSNTSLSIICGEEYDNVSANQFRLQFLSNRIGACFTDGSGNGPFFQSSVNSVPTNSWTHVALTRSGSVYSLYINGVLDNSTTYSGVNLTSNPYPFRVGARGNLSAQNPFEGDIDEVRAWSRALCANEIVNNMNGSLPSPATQPGLILYYNMNQGTASGMNTSITALTDASASGNNASLNNFALTSSSSNFVTSTVATTTASAFGPSTPTVTATASSVCSGSGTTLTITGNLNGAANWAIYTAGCGAGTSVSNTSGTYSTGALSATTTYYVRGEGNCLSAPGSCSTPVTVTVKPVPVATAIPVSQTICNGSVISTIALTSTVSGSTYTWTRDNTANVTGINASGSGNISGSLTNVATGTTIPAETTTFTIIPTANGCVGTASTATATVNPTPDVAQPANQIVCANGTTAVPFNGVSAGTTYNWTNTATSIGLAGIGTGSIGSFTATNTTTAPVTANITVTPVIASNSSITYAYVPNYGSNNVSVINTATNTVVGSPITVNTNPISAAYSPDGSRVYVAHQGSNDISIINTATNTVSGSYPVSGIQHTIAVSPDGSRVCASNFNSNTVAMVNTATSAVTFITVGNTPCMLAFSPDGSKLYVANQQSNSVSVINVATNAVVSTISLSISPLGLAISPDGSKIYVGDVNANNVVVISTASNTVLSTIALSATGLGLRGLATNLDGTRLYVSGYGANVVWVINTANNSVVATIPVGSMPRGIGITPDGNNVYVANSGGNTVSVINTTSNSVTSSITVGSLPYAYGQIIGKSGPCSGSSKTFSITVNPKPTVTKPSNQVVCNSASTTAVTLTGTVSGTAYSWTVSGASIGLSNGSGSSIPAFTATNSTNAPVTATVTVIPSYTNPSGGSACSGTAQSFTITVNPTPTAVATLPAQAPCDGASTTSIIMSGAVSGTTYNWTNNTTSIGLAASGSGDIGAFTATNSTSAPVTATITVMPSYSNGGTTCTGSDVTATITVNPKYVVTSSVTGSNGTISPSGTTNVCSGTNQTYTITASTAGAGYHIDDIVVDGSSLSGSAATTAGVGTGSGSYTFSNVTATHTINATFAPNCTPAAVSGCPANQTGMPSVNPCSAVVSYAAPTVTGTPTPSIAYAFSGATTGSGSGTGSGLAFNTGVTNVTITASNGCGADATCSFTVSVSGPVQNITTGLYYCKIQDAIDDVLTLNGNTITVAAGTYAEDITVNKSVTILGPNSAINPCSGTLVPQAIIIPATSDYLAGTVVDITANDVTFSGFTVNGDNPALTSTAVSMGADIDASNGVYSTGNNTKVNNNVVKNIFSFGITLDGDAGTTSTSNGYTGEIKNNKLFNIPDWAAITAYGNYYTAIENNCMNDVWEGVLVEQFYKPKPAGAVGTVTGNTLASGGTAYTVGTTPTTYADMRGIRINNHFGTTSPWTCSNNTFTNTAATPGALSRGIQVLSLFNTNSLVIASNTVTGYDRGYDLWNCPTSNTLTISGGTVSNCNIGILPNNWEGYGPSNGASSAFIVDGVAITGSLVAGIKVSDNPSNTNNATVAVEIKNNTAITGSPIGILVSGSDASANIHNNNATISSNTTGIEVNGGIATIYQNKLSANGTGLRAVSGGRLTPTTQNFIVNNSSDGIRIESTAGTIGAINGNDLSGNTGFAIKNLATPTINATCNWFGSNVPATVAGKVSGNVTYIPYLSGGADLGGNAADGFQSSVACSACALSTTAAVTPLYPMSGQEIQTIYVAYTPQSAQSETVTATTTGGTGNYSYSWTKTGGCGSSPTTSGVGTNANAYTYNVDPADACNNNNDNVYTFTVLVTDNNGCSATTFKKINVVNPFVGSNVQVCHKVAVRGGSSTQILQVAPSQVSTHLAHGDYLGNCAVFTGVKLVIPEIAEEQNVTVYPNPTTGVFILELSSIKEGAQIMITDVAGKLIALKSIAKDATPTATFDLSNLAKGMYLIQVRDGDLNYRTKIVIQ